jgi:hypothetical protein
VNPRTERAVSDAREQMAHIVEEKMTLNRIQEQIRPFWAVLLHLSIPNLPHTLNARSP